MDNLSSPPGYGGRSPTFHKLPALNALGLSLLTQSQKRLFCVCAIFATLVICCASCSSERVNLAESIVNSGGAILVDPRSGPRTLLEIPSNDSSRTVKGISPNWYSTDFSLVRSGKVVLVAIDTADVDLIDVLRCFPEVLSVELRGNAIDQSKIAVANVKARPREIWFRHCPVSAAQLLKLGVFSDVESVTFQSTPASANFLDGLQSNDSIHSLSLISLSLGATEWDVIQQCQYLTKLQLLRVEGALHMPTGFQWPENLRQLDLQECGLQDSFVDSLRTAKSLEYLNVRFNHLTQNGVATLNGLRENLVVVADCQIDRSIVNE